MSVLPEEPGMSCTRSYPTYHLVIPFIHVANCCNKSTETAEYHCCCNCNLRCFPCKKAPNVNDCKVVVKFLRRLCLFI
ncbi:hypothetical protein RIF29_12869 [Crotalaria pallida]|uniref:Uncharacterized protein n=1 Tax=Crotalaria pallida TaxID=3830 RepID=A0AAN9INN5_CROPI